MYVSRPQLAGERSHYQHGLSEEVREPGLTDGVLTPQVAGGSALFSWEGESVSEGLAELPHRVFSAMS